MCFCYVLVQNSGYPTKTQHWSSDFHKYWHLFLTYIGRDKMTSISLTISLRFVHKGSINNIPVLVQIIAWCQTVDKPLSEPMMVNLLTHICDTRPQWASTFNLFYCHILMNWWRAWHFCLSHFQWCNGRHLMFHTHIRTQIASMFIFCPLFFNQTIYSVLIFWVSLYF